MLKVCLIDSHPSFRYGLRQLLQANFQNIHIDEFPTCELFILAQIEVCDLVVAGINEDTQFQIILKLSRSLFSNTKIMVFYTSGHYNDVLTHLSIRLNAFLNKNIEINKIWETLDTIINQPQNQQGHKIPGRKYPKLFPDQVSEFKLSDREFEIAYYLTRGMRTTEISNLMQIRPSTVSTYKHRIFKKTETANVIELRDLMHL